MLTIFKDYLEREETGRALSKYCLTSLIRPHVVVDSKTLVGSALYPSFKSIFLASPYAWAKLGSNLRCNVRDFTRMKSQCNDGANFMISYLIFNAYMDVTRIYELESCRAHLKAYSLLSETVASHPANQATLRDHKLLGP